MILSSYPFRWIGPFWRSTPRTTWWRVIRFSHFCDQIFGHKSGCTLNLIGGMSSLWPDLVLFVTRSGSLWSQIWSHSLPDGRHVPLVYGVVERIVAAGVVETVTLETLHRPGACKKQGPRLVAFSKLCPSIFGKIFKLAANLRAWKYKQSCHRSVQNVLHPGIFHVRWRHYEECNKREDDYAFVSRFNLLLDSWTICSTQ